MLSQLSRTHLILLLALLALGVGARFVGLNFHGLWIDEISTLVRFSDPQDSLSTLLFERIVQDHTPPLYYVTIYAWRHVVEVSEWSMRLPGVLAGVLSIVLAYTMAVPGLKRGTRLVYATLLACSFGAIFYAQEVRAYSFMMLFAVVMTGGALAVQERLLRAGTVAWPWLLALTLSAILNAYTHYFGFLLAGAIFSVLTLTGLFWRRWQATWRIALCGLTVLAALAPWLLAQYWLKTAPPAGFIENDLMFYVKAFGRFALYYGGSWAGFALFCAVLGLFAVALLRTSVARFGRPHSEALPRKNELAPTSLRHAWALVLFGTLVIAYALVISFLLDPIVTWRNLLVLLPALNLLTALALTTEATPLLSRLRGAYATPALLVLFVLTFAVPVLDYATTRKTQWREAADYIGKLPQCQEADVIVWSDWTDLYRFYLDDGVRPNLLAAGNEAPEGSIEQARSAQRPDDCPIKLWAGHISEEEFAAFAADLGLDLTRLQVIDFADNVLVIEPQPNLANSSATR